jgi:hypothetical protein
LFFAKTCFSTTKGEGGREREILRCAQNDGREARAQGKQEHKAAVGVSRPSYRFRARRVHVRGMLDFQGMRPTGKDDRDHYG